jgi:hypothetical protein
MRKDRHPVVALQAETGKTRRRPIDETIERAIGQNRRFVAQGRPIRESPGAVTEKFVEKLRHGEEH